jgi:replication-associated recombination protein RarA
VAEMSCLPEHLRERRYYQPTSRGEEQRMKNALDSARQIRERKD